MSYTYDFPRPAVTVDIVIVTWVEEELRTLLIRRGHPPFEGGWAIPGGFVDMDESLGMAARRELEEETGVRLDRLEQFHTFGAPGRDPRGRVISVAHLALVPWSRIDPSAGSDASEVGWHSLTELPSLAFDHAEILDRAAAHLRLRARTTASALSLLEPPFSLEECHALYEVILGRPLDSDRFRTNFAEMGILREQEGGYRVRRDAGGFETRLG